VSSLSKTELLAASEASKQFFFENFYMIPDVINGGLTKFVLRDFQKDILSDIDSKKNIIGLKARQIGWTTLAVANALHDVLFNDLRPWKFISRNEKAAQDMVGKATIAYYRLPPWMRQALPKLKSETQGRLEFDNLSFIEAEPATGSSFRGDAVHGLLMDECAYMEYADEIWGAAEAGVYGTRMLFSTANGMGNFFHEIWLDAQRPGSAWHSIFYPWSVVDERDDVWHENKRLEYRGREWQFYQEYPTNPEEAFAKSGRVAFAGDVIDPNFVEQEPVRRLEWIIGSEPRDIDIMERVDIPIEIWREPEVVRDEENDRPKWKPNYVVGCDTAEGLEHGDFTYVTVFDVNTREQVAASKSAIPISYLDDLLVWLAEYYHKALVIVERNMTGYVPLDRLYRDHWYPRLYRMDRFAEIKMGDRTPQYGWRTDKATKPKMVNDFFYALNEVDVVLHDPEFVLEAQTFVADGKGSYSATNNNHDDVIMGTLVAWQGVLDSHKYEIVWRDDRILPPTHDDVDAIIYQDRTWKNIDWLELPVGQKRREEKSVGSITFTPANFKKSNTN
jgi:hypothetical protein